METTNTTENLLGILMAMKKIRPIDQSDYFKKYFEEVEYRIYVEQQGYKREECISFEEFKSKQS
jgi:hypothetical protein